MKQNNSYNQDTTQELRQLAANIKIARKRRKLPLRTLSKQTGISIATLNRLEAGDSSVGIGKVFQVLSVLNLLKGISDLVSPETDVQQLLHEVRDRRAGRQKRLKEVFSRAELDF